MNYLMLLSLVLPYLSCCLLGFNFGASTIKRFEGWQRPSAARLLAYFV